MRKFTFQPSPNDDNGNDNDNDHSQSDQKTTAEEMVRQVALRHIPSSVKHRLSGADLSSIATSALMSSIQRTCNLVEEEVTRRNAAALVRQQQALLDEEYENLERESKTTILTQALPESHNDRLFLHATTVEDVVNDWETSLDKKELLTPVINCQDLINACQNVVPSVSETELEQYEALRAQFDG
mmetsp:Transcript_60634/g.70935  ORF Transcript_60634/g.70935 Transcript_60634/m.70935 type:complete len:185 (+) Transcript_60634:1065-1619(+)